MTNSAARARDELEVQVGVARRDVGAPHAAPLDGLVGAGHRWLPFDVVGIAPEPKLEALVTASRERDVSFVIEPIAERLAGTVAAGAGFRRERAAWDWRWRWRRRRRRVSVASALSSSDAACGWQSRLWCSTRGEGGVTARTLSGNTGQTHFDSRAPPSPLNGEVGLLPRGELAEGIPS